MNGETIRNLQLPYGFLSETEHQPAAIPRHSHEPASFCLVLRGEFRETRSGAERAFGRRDVIFRAPDEPHSNRFERGGARCFNVLIDPALLVRAGGGDADLRAASPILRRLLRETRLGENQLVIEGLVLQLVGEAFGPALLRRSLVSEAAWIIETRFTESLSVRAIATELAVHPVHLSRSFRRHRGMSIVELIRRLRIEYAAELLRDGRPSIADIAARTGFADQSHFTRTFRDATGLTPGEYRRRRK